MSAVQSVPSEAPARSLGLVVNRKSGAALGADPLPRLLELLKERGAEPAATEEAAAADVVPAIERVVASGVDRLVLFGGDGTIAAAAGALVGKPIELALIPGGTMNLLAQNLCVPLDPARALDAAVNGHAREIDVGDVNGHVFLVASVLGLPAQIQQAREAHRDRAKPIAWLKLALAAVDALERYPSLRLELDLGEGPRRVRTRTLCITGPDVCDDAAESGELNLYILQPTRRWRALLRTLALTLGRAQGRPGLVQASGDRFVVDSHARSLHVMNDGETKLLTPPLVFTIRRKALRIVVP
jgi:diacylglycerol kinase family enzyme